MVAPGHGAAPHKIYDQDAPPPSRICTTETDTMTQIKILLKKSHKITHPFINFIFIARKLNNPSEKSNVYFDISSEKGN